ncbi:hypothetical protein ACHAXS_014381 [Conticribra weissflogii]
MSTKRPQHDVSLKPFSLALSVCLLLGATTLHGAPQHQKLAVVDDDPSSAVSGPRSQCSFDCRDGNGGSSKGATSFLGSRMFVHSFSPSEWTMIPRGTSRSRTISSPTTQRIPFSQFSRLHRGRDCNFGGSNHVYCTRRSSIEQEDFRIIHDHNVQPKITTTTTSTTKKKKVRSRDDYEDDEIVNDDDYQSSSSFKFTTTNPDRAAHTQTETEKATGIGIDIDIDVASVDEAQVLLACRSYLLRKHKLEWTEKKRREEAANSPLHNEGYFWPNPSELIYLREKPDPFDLTYYGGNGNGNGNGTAIGQRHRKSKKHGNDYFYSNHDGEVGDDLPFSSSFPSSSYGNGYGGFENKFAIQQKFDKNNDDDDDDSNHHGGERTVSWWGGNNPFSTNPAFTYPSSEHIKRSNSKLRLWNNSTWKEEWYEKRWRGKIISQDEKTQRRQDKLLSDIPLDVLESPKLASLSEEEVTEAIVSYLVANRKKSEARRRVKRVKELERRRYREWRTSVQSRVEKARDDGATTMRDILLKIDVDKKGSNGSSGDALSFEPSVNVMKKLRKKRGEQSKRAFETRLANLEANATASSSKRISMFPRSPNRIRSFSRHYNNDFNDKNDINSNNINGEDEFEEELSPMQAILRIDMALDHNETPSPVDVETILKPGRLGRRRSLLRRILSECFGLRGKCVPRLVNRKNDVRLNEYDSVEKEEEATVGQELVFTTKCTIEELGSFVLVKLREKIRSQTLAGDNVSSTKAE